MSLDEKTVADLVAEFQSGGGKITQLPEPPKLPPNTLLVKVLKAREQIGSDDRAFGSYFYVEHIGSYSKPLPEKFGIASTLKNLEIAKVGEVFCFPVKQYFNHENSKKLDHNIIFRTTGDIYRPGEKPAPPVKRISRAEQRLQKSRAKEKARMQKEREQAQHKKVFNEVAPPPTLEQILEKMTAQERIKWAFKKHKKHLGLTASFGIQSAVLLHMVSQIAPDTKIIFLDTQHLHPETYRYKRDLVKSLGLKLHTYRADMSAAEQLALFGERWENGLANEAYKWQNKVEPMDRAKSQLGITCWLSGLRREQSERRANVPIIEQDAGIEKIYPIIDWTEAQIVDYMNEHNLPFHPLSWEGYRTIGDYFENPDVRAECGLHVPIESFDPKI